MTTSEVSDIIGRKDIAAAVAILTDAAEIRIWKNQWEILDLTKLVCGSRAEKYIEGFFLEAFDLWPDFLPLQIEIMESSIERDTVHKAACNIIRIIAKRVLKGKTALVLWEMKAYLQALCIAGGSDDLTTTDIIASESSNGEYYGHLALVRKLIPFLHGVKAAIERPETRHPAPQIDCILCVRAPDDHLLCRNGTPFYIELEQLDLDFDDLIDAFAVKIFLRAIWIRIGSKGALQHDRCLVTLQLRAHRTDICAYRFLSMVHFFLDNAATQNLRGLGGFHVRQDFPGRGLELSGSYVRAGIVELTMVECYLANRNLTLAAVKSVADDLWRARDDETDDNLVERLREPLQPYGNSPETCILRLCMQAGWYSKPESAVHNFEYWVNSYLEAFRESRAIEGVNKYFVPILPFGFPTMLDPTVFRGPQFFEILNGRKLVFVSAFAPEIAAFHANGNLESVWKAVGIRSEIAALATIPAPFSIWPQYPDGGWRTSFEKLLEKSTDQILNIKADVFLVSAGCYSAPLANAVGKRFPEILSLHYGHHVNTCFGVASGKTNLLKQYGLPDDAAPLIWSNLGTRYPGVLNRADLHRYS